MSTSSQCKDYTALCFQYYYYSIVIIHRAVSTILLFHLKVCIATTCASADTIPPDLSVGLHSPPYYCVETFIQIQDQHDIHALFAANLSHKATMQCAVTTVTSGFTYDVLESHKVNITGQHLGITIFT